jgi:hypothetical protein
VIAGSIENPNSIVSIGIYPFIGEEQNYSLPQGNVIYSIIGDSIDCNYQLSDNIDGWVEILEYNPFERYISGTFEYTAVNKSCDTVRITDGRFDLPVRR